MTLCGFAEWRLFPPLGKQAPPTTGDEVFVRAKSAKEIGKKGVFYSSEKVEIPASAADSVAPSPEAKIARDSGSGGGSSGVGGGETTIWKEAKKQKKTRKKGKKREDTRVVVRISRGDDGSKPFDCRARPSRLVPIYKIPTNVDGSTPPTTAGTPILILLTAETHSFRLLAASQVCPSDRVLEVGCSTGETTAVLVKYVPRGQVVAFDVGADMVDRTKERLELAAAADSTRARARVRVSKIDPFLDPRGAVEAASALLPPVNGDSADEQPDVGKRDAEGNRQVDVVFIDIGGNRELRGVVRMIAFARTAFDRPPRLIVVKSQALVAQLEGNHGEDEKADIGCASAATEATSKPGSFTGCGKIVQGDTWFRELLARSTAAEASSGQRAAAEGGGGAPNTSGQQNIPKHFHPNKAPLRLSPKDGVTPICRYHNYHREGCKKGERCPFEHAVCHWCLGPGHAALDCDDAGELRILG